MYRFVHVGFYFPKVPKVQILEPVFAATGDDWIRYSANSWIIWTEKTPSDLYNHIRPHLHVEDQVLIVRLDLSEGFGWLSPWIWTWINSKVPGTILTGQPAQSPLPIPPPPWWQK